MAIDYGVFITFDPGSLFTGIENLVSSLLAKPTFENLVTPQGNEKTLFSQIHLFCKDIF
jgi:hypothetical protein